MFALGELALTVTVKLRDGIVKKLVANFQVKTGCEKNLWGSGLFFVHVASAIRCLRL